MVSGAWARSTPAGASAGAIYLTIESEAADRLTDVSVPAEVAGAAQMHEMAHSPEGFMTMHRLNSIELPAHAPVRFAPGGMHIMLLQLARPLAVGDSVLVTLRFEKSAPLVVIAPVRDE
jgi:copper(I)-binding protein